MKLRESVPIGTQISVLPAITFVGFILVLILQYGGLTNQAKVNESNLQRLSLTENLRKFQQQITTVRISEKNFFSTGEVKYSEDHERAMQTLFNTLNIFPFDQNSIVNTRHISEWRALLSEYQNIYLSASIERETIGFSENTGLRGSMRNAIHDVEARLKDKNAVLMRDMLSMRRHEKDFIIRGKEKFYRQWLTSIGTFNHAVSTADLSPVDQSVIRFNTRLYVNSFKNLAAHKRHLAKALIKTEIASNHLLKSIGFTFTKVSIVARDQIGQLYNGALSEFRNIAVLTLLIGLLVVLTSRWIGGGIRSSFKLITTATTKLARRDINTRIPATSYTNEIGEIAKALQFFRENEKQRLLADINLKSAKMHTENIVKTMCEGLFEIDIQGKIVFTNPAAEKLTGFDQNTMIGRNISSIFTKGNASESKLPEQFLHFLFSKKNSAPNDMQMLNSSGKSVSVSCSSGILFDSEDQKTGAILTVQDITERKAIERTKSEFLSTVSHELRTPLTSIKGALGIINSGALGDLNETTQKMVTIALSNSNRLATLINDILDFEKIEAGKMEFHMEPVNLSELIVESLASNEGYATTYGVHFKATGVNQPIIVSGDKCRLM